MNTPLPCVWCLTLFDQGGAIVGFFYHLNRAAVEDKARELKDDPMIGAQVFRRHISRYTLDADDAEGGETR